MSGNLEPCEERGDEPPLSKSLGRVPGLNSLRRRPYGGSCLACKTFGSTLRLVSLERLDGPSPGGDVDSSLERGCRLSSDRLA